MHRYTALGVLADAAAGRRVLVVGPSHALLSDVADEIGVLAVGEPEVQSIRRAVGRRRISMRSGGAVIFVAQGSSSALRGRSADVLVLVDGAVVDEDVEVITALCGAELIKA